MIASDVSWLKKPSAESEMFWKNICSEVGTIEEKIFQIKDKGYEFVYYVVVSKKDWKDFHVQLESNLKSISSDESAKDFTKQLKKEIETYRRNSDDYSYVFYIMKKT